MLKIHVVQPGESIWSLSQLYGVRPEIILNTNGIGDIPFLIPGQALVIPVDAANYTVRPGESLYRIATRFQIPLNAILAANPTLGSTLYPGTVLRIPFLGPNLGPAEINGYIIPGSENDTEMVVEAGRSLTYIAPFSYQVAPDGSLSALNEEVILTTAQPFNVTPMMVITNYRNGNFDAELAHTILSSPTVQDKLFRNILAIMRSKRYLVLNIDFERIPAADRELYNTFLRRIVPVMHANNYLVATDLVPKPYDITTGGWHGAHDYRAHGEIVDFVILMTYDWGWAGGPPLPIAPINNVRQVLDYAVSVIPREKIMLGVPFYGYDWILPYQQGGPWATMISNVDAIRLAAQHGAFIQYDTNAQAPFFNYYDSAGRQHIVWFEDARSLLAKYRLVPEYRIRGVSYWVLNLPFPQNWPIVNSVFRIRKNPTLYGETAAPAGTTI